MPRSGAPDPALDGERIIVIEPLLQAERALTVGLLDQAERLYAGVLAADPRNSIAAVGLARVALERGDDRGALILARQALAIDPENVAAQRLVLRLEEVMTTRGEELPGPEEATVSVPSRGRAPSEGTPSSMAPPPAGGEPPVSPLLALPDQAGAGPGRPGPLPPPGSVPPASSIPVPVPHVAPAATDDPGIASGTVPGTRAGPAASDPAEPSDRTRGRPPRSLLDRLLRRR